jgi:hypothetical protein
VVVTKNINLLAHTFGQLSDFFAGELDVFGLRHGLQRMHPLGYGPYGKYADAMHRGDAQSAINRLIQMFEDFIFQG